MAGNKFREVTTTTTDDEKQNRNGQDHVRVYDPNADMLLKELLEELKEIKTLLQMIGD